MINEISWQNNDIKLLFMTIQYYWWQFILIHANSVWFKTIHDDSL